MKKGSVIALIVAAALILTGGIILVLGLSFAGGSEAHVTTLTQNEHALTAPFDSILIDTEDCNVNFVLLEKGAAPYVILRERDKAVHSVLVEDGVLKIKMMDERKWYDRIGIFREEMELVVYLPESQYDMLRIDTATGDINVPARFAFSEAELFSDTGEIRVAAAVTKHLNGGTATGDISVVGAAPSMLNLTSDTGDIELSDISGCEAVYLKTATGSQELENVTCQTLSTQSATGEIELEQVSVAAYWLAVNETGDVSFTDSDAGEVSITTTTGDVTGNFLTPKIFWAHSETGKEQVPDVWEGGECRIQSDTGDIIVR